MIPSLDGRGHLSPCLASLGEMTYPHDRTEIIVVDNGSTDGSVAFISESFPGVTVLPQATNLGFARACNLGAKKASGEIVVFLNNDMKVDTEWLGTLIRPIREGRAASTGSKVLSWDGSKVDFAGAVMNFEAKGAQVAYGEKYDPDKHDRAGEMLFANGGSMAINRRIFLDSGGFDGDYFAFYEDVDLGWRLWILGERVIYVPESIAYHRHHGTSSRFHPSKLRVLYERNSIITALKNYSDEFLGRMLTPALFMAVERFFEDSALDVLSFELGGQRDPMDQGASADGLASLIAIRQVLDQLPSIMQKRAWVQERRRRGDPEIFRLFGEPHLASRADPKYQKLQVDLQRTFGIYDAFSPRDRPHVLIVTNDVVGKKMAGPGIRCVELARVLSRDCEVTVAASNKPDLEAEFFRAVHGYPKMLEEVGRKSDVIICQGLAFAINPWLASLRIPVVVDLYDPFPLALLEQNRGKEGPERWKENESARKAVEFQLSHGDFFVCASEKQRAMWLGALEALGRINPGTYDEDRTLRRLIDVVPFGISSEPPKHTRRVLRSVHPEIKEDDFVVIWAGGLYNWFDPLSLIEAVGMVIDRHPKLKLVFLGTRHPNLEIPEMEIAMRSRSLSKDLGLEDKHIFFNEDWIPYSERANFLLESDVGVSFHLPTIETDFSFRTRVLDYIWANLPMIVTEGDTLADLAKSRDLGLTVPPNSSTAIAEALVNLIEDPDGLDRIRANLRDIAKDFTWEKAAESLHKFCFQPRFAPDSEGRPAPATPPSIGPISRIRFHYQRGGIKGVATGALRVLKMRLLRINR